MSHKKTATSGNRAPSKPANDQKPNLASLLAKPSANCQPVSEEAIRLCAYQKWEAAGKPSGDGIQFWLEAVKELVEGENEKFVQEGGWHGNREHERREAEKDLKEGNVSVDSHYRDNNRMFQSHGERGHRHGGNG